MTLFKYLLIPGLFIFFSCKQYHRNQSHRDIRNGSVDSGEVLARQYCQSCHAFPDPSLLDVNSWQKGVLPNMGPRLGIFSYGWNIYPSYRGDQNVPKGFYPSRPLLNPVEWQHIIDYYTATAPDTLLPQERPLPIKNDLDLFRVSAPLKTEEGPMTCFIHVDTTVSPHSILRGDAFHNSLIRYNRNLSAVDSISFSGPVVDVDYHGPLLVATDIGHLNPTNARLGRIRKIIQRQNGNMSPDSTWGLDSLRRPVQSIMIDLNADGRPDELVCEFGHITGALSWFENLGNNQYVRHILRAFPGAIKAYVRDYNHDGLPDLFVLFAQGDEGVYLFTNRGKGQFDQKQILRFPPSYGSSYFELDDFNGDGYADILYTCGDNADFSVILKPYHGVYLFLNDGNWNFSQKYFFPINGCYKALASDFDGDGDLDIATISYFADYQKQPEEGFVYLENKGNLQFRPHSMTQVQHGRWLTMDVGDLDGDGKPDILLGNFSKSPAFIKPAEPWEKEASFLFLKNISGKR